LVLLRSIRFSGAALILRFERFVGPEADLNDAGAVSESIARSSAISTSIWRFCFSKPRMAAATIAFVNQLLFQSR
jgi:hypothetical protein